MGVALKKHNEEIYEKVEEMLKEVGKTAVIQPTGTGKTYISLRLIERTKGKTIYVAPTAHILNQVKETIENARKNGELSEEEYARYQEVEYITYRRLMELSKVESGYENIILDEMHRCGAPEWGKGVKRLLEAIEGAKVLGLTATPKRAVDNRDMALEMFGENIASEMTLEEAVAEGIIQAPTYISAIYSLQNAIIETEQKIEKITDEGKKQELREKITQVKRNLEKADGLEEIFAKYANKPDGKYIVFCNDIKDMHKKMQEAKKWFSKVGDVRLYEVSYKKSEELNEDTIRRFREEGEKINLLFTVDKLNEGIHVDGIDGVIMLRTTGSPIVYMQQLGRALSAGNEGTPLVFDFVNNLESSNYKEFIERVRGIQRERGIESTIGNIEIIELQREVREVLEEINRKLERSSALTSARKIKQWMEERNTTKPPSPTSKDIIEKRLGRTLHNIKQYWVKPYLNLKAEEERKVYRKKHPEIEEIMQIVQEIDKNNRPYLRNAKKIKEWMEERNTKKPPTQFSKDEVEMKRGRELSSIRQQLIKPYLNLKTEEEREEYRKKHPEIEEVMQIVQEIDEKSGKNVDSIERTLKIAEILNSNGVNLTILTLSKKGIPLLLSEIEQEGVDIQKIIEENELDGTFAFGSNVNSLRKIYKGTRGKDQKRQLSEQERKKAEELGLVEIEEKESTVSKVLRIAEILKNNGVDLPNLSISKKIKVGERKKQIYFLLSEIEQKGVDIQKIIEENGLDGDFEFGSSVNYLRKVYAGTNNRPITETEKRKAEELGLISEKMMQKQRELQKLLQSDANLRAQVEEARKLEQAYEEQLGNVQIEQGENK